MTCTGTFLQFMKVKKSFKCDSCDACFTYKHILKRHIASVHEGKKPFVVCDTCDARFASKYDMKGHISSVHEGKKLFKCTNCDACYKHISTLHEIKRFRCAKYDATFTQKANLNLHKKSFHKVKKIPQLQLL